MEDLLFALNAVAPIIIIVALGYILKRIGIIPVGLAKPLNKIVFRVLLPVMLFYNVYKINNIGSIDFGYLVFVAVSVAALFLIALPLSFVLTKEQSRRAVLIQVVFRSNYALIGIPLAISLFGNEGAAIATILSAVSIPVFNICAVVALSLFDPSGKKPSVIKVLRGIVTNPLIIGIALGLLTVGIRAIFDSAAIDFRLSDIGAFTKVMDYLSGAATPVALLALGAQFEFSAVSSMKREIISGTLLRVAIVPTVVLSIALLFKSFTGAHFAAFVGLYCTPLAVSTVPMTQEMGSDSELAGQLVIWTTLFSALSIFLFSYILKLIGIF